MKFSQICSRLARGSPIRETAAGRRVDTVPITLVLEDFEGNLTKKWNKMRIWTMQVAGMSMAGNTNLSSMAFLFTSSNNSVCEPSMPIVDEFMRLENGIPMFDAKYDEEVLVTAPKGLLKYDLGRNMLLRSEK